DAPDDAPDDALRVPDGGGSSLPHERRTAARSERARTRPIVALLDGTPATEVHALAVEPRTAAGARGARDVLVVGRCERSSAWPSSRAAPRPASTSGASPTATTASSATGGPRAAGSLRVDA